MFLRKGLIIKGREMGDYWIERLKGSGLNTLGIHPAGSAVVAAFIKNCGSPEHQRFIRQLNDLGIDQEYEMHAISWMLPRELFSQNPGLFRVDANLSRNPDVNMCFSNPDALQIIKDQAAVLASVLKSPTGRYFMWAEDVDGDCYCHCQNCREYSNSDQYLMFVNAALAGARQVDPQAKMAFLAYLTTLDPPRKVNPDPGVFLEYAPIRRDQYIPINDMECVKNAEQIKSLPDLLSFFGTKGSQVLEYWLDNSRFSSWKYPVRKYQFDAEIARRDIQFYQSAGFESATCFACNLAEDYYVRYGEPPIEPYYKLMRSS